jgi:hypothetical protein
MLNPPPQKVASYTSRVVQVAAGRWHCSARKVERQDFEVLKAGAAVVRQDFRAQSASSYANCHCACSEWLRARQAQVCQTSSSGPRNTCIGLHLPRSAGAPANVEGKGPHPTEWGLASTITPPREGSPQNASKTELYLKTESDLRLVLRNNLEFESISLPALSSHSKTKGNSLLGFLQLFRLSELT